MPTLIRLVVILLVLAGLVYGGMFALVAMVEPKEDEVTLTIPARDLLPQTDRDPLVLREIDTSRTPASPPPADASAPSAPANAPASDDAPVAPGSGPAIPPPTQNGNGEAVTQSPGVE